MSERNGLPPDRRHLGPFCIRTKSGRFFGKIGVFVANRNVTIFGKSPTACLLSQIDRGAERNGRFGGSSFVKHALLISRETAVGLAMAIVLAAGYVWCSGSLMLASQLLAADEPKTEEPKAEESATGEAKRFVEQSHAALANRRSVQATLYQVVNINGQPLKLTGRYANAGLKLRLELATELPGGAKGSLLEVCDGNVLWSQLQLLDSRRVTRRDIRQILAAVSAGDSRPEAILTAELGLGGLPGLLAGLQQQLEFESLERITESDREMVVIRARWKPDALTKLGLKPDQATPEYIPDFVRLWFDAETQVPVKIDYLKKAADKLPERAIVSLQFRDVVLDQAVDESLFLFVPPEDVVPEDITRAYVEQITRTGPNAPK